MLTKEELPDCPVATTLRVIGSKWKIFIIQRLLDHPHRFGELRDSIEGISEKSLIEALRQMADDGIIVRTEYPELPRHVEYRLSDLGESMRPMIQAMAEWGTAYQAIVREG
ncbi:MAG: helix-turn-helix domain-containing protein [Coriobacteriia bacterium]|nr:helix-turn-helix domain-containing protein [Coriobacteriia bacterium]